MTVRRRQLRPESVRFRKRIIGAFWDHDRWGVYLSEDRFLGTCPICGAPVGVTFAGYAPRATLQCHGGCTEHEIADRLGLAVRS
ncbi:MAG: hypothetical protein ACXVS6_15635 [Solirubrobacteraceae bacterium]